MIVRSMKAYGLPTWIRVTVGRRSQNVQFYKLLKKYLSTHK
jgi:histidinol-phosphate/aromatic aminotransferase/cobyric acid decarboxylase-like protein